jgi:hypothetical protein
MTTETEMPDEQLSRLESVDRHRLWQNGLDKEEFFNDVFATKK